MTAPTASPRRRNNLAISDAAAPRRNDFIERNSYFHAEDHRFLRFLVPKGKSVVELGCSTGRLLAALEPARGVGLDLSPAAIDIARRDFPDLDFVVGDVEDPDTIEKLGGPFDVVVLSDVLGYVDDCQSTLEAVRLLCHADTRIVITYYNHLWEPALKLAERVGLRMPSGDANWLRPEDIENLLDLAGFQFIGRHWRQLLPRHAFGLGPLVNRYLATLPGIRRLCLRDYIVARLAPEPGPELSVTIVIPCRNERGNIAPIVERTPPFGADMEIIFVEGHSQDGTFEEVERVMALYPDRDIKLTRQDGKGKGDAVRKGFAMARGDVLMILDADMTVPPEDLPKFYRALVDGKGEYINGTRLVFPMEKGAMRFLNMMANHTFSLLFTWLLNQRYTDTLCGTKVLRKSHYEEILRNRHYFGDFDPFGDFDLIFGAAKLNLKSVEVPIRYAARSYGETQISRFRHGWLLLRMVLFAYKKLKAL